MHLFSQTETDEQLASAYFQNKEYDKAVELYEKVYVQKPNLANYTKYIECLIKLEEFGKTEKIIKKQIKLYPAIPRYSVDLGYLWSVQGKLSQAQQYYESLIKNAPKDKQYIIDLADAFLYRNEIDYALQTYIAAKKTLNGAYSFHKELAEIYEDNKEYELMMDEYISLLEFDISNITEIQALLQTIVVEETDGLKSEALKNVLLKRLKKYPAESFYSEMLLWYSTQIKDFETAFIQAKAIDRRLNEDGKKVIDVARLASTNKSYDVAIAAYQYIINKGVENYYYLNSRMEMLDVKYTKITDEGVYTSNDLLELEKDYNSVLTELGKSTATISFIKNLAHLQAFYLNKSNDAIKLLYETLEFKTAKASSLAECKIELADVLLMTGEVWEATLLYSQVEKAFKDEPIGHTAKFKNAKLTYFIGEFEWAKAQLDVLKAATSKLIANDAMELSLLINDNSDLDSTYDALLLFAKANLYEFRNKYDSALFQLDSLFIKYSYHTLFDEAYFKKAQIYYKKGLIDSAIANYNQIILKYSFDILADDATYKLALIYENVNKDKVKAMELYQIIMTSYPGSTYVVEARKKYRLLRGDIVN